MNEKFSKMLIPPQYVKDNPQSHLAKAAWRTVSNIQTESLTECLARSELSRLEA